MNFDRIEMMKEAQSLQEKKSLFIDYFVNECGGDEKIIDYIAGILYHGGNGVKSEDSIETIRCLFEAGYCYMFAKNLERVFPGGQVCLCYNFGHVVYVYDEVAYDIHGVTDAEYEELIPVEIFGDLILDFEHRKDFQKAISLEELEKIAKEYLSKGNSIFALSEYPKCKEVVNRCKEITSKNTSSEYMKDKINFLLEKNRIEKDFEKGYITEAQKEQFLSEYCIRKNLSWKLIKRLSN